MAKIAQRLFIYTAIILLGGLLGANVYNSVVDAPNWGSAIPQSLEAARHYFSSANPGTFYRVASPAAQAAALIALIATWNFGWRVRALAATALLLAVMGDVLTFAYFYPRNAILFGSEAQSSEALRLVWAGWSTMNWVRSSLCLLAVLCELLALSQIEAYSNSKPDRG